MRGGIATAVALCATVALTACAPPMGAMGLLSGGLDPFAPAEARAPAVWPPPLCRPEIPPRECARLAAHQRRRDEEHRRFMERPTVHLHCHGYGCAGGGGWTPHRPPYVPPPYPYNPGW
jgi:hypothetical protein